MTSNRTTRARPAGPRASTPARRSRSRRRANATRAASASAIVCDPPRGSGQPTACPVIPSTRPKAAVSGRSSGSIACAASPAKSAARPLAAEQRAAPAWPRARPRAARSRAIASGWRGTRRTGPSSARASPSQCADQRSRTAAARRPRPAPSSRAVSSTERSSTPAVPSSRGCARGSGGWIHSSPCSPSGTVGRTASRRPGVDRGAHVVAEARQGELRRAVAAADRGRRLEHEHGPAAHGQGQRGGQPVGTRAHDHRVVGAIAEAVAKRAHACRLSGQALRRRWHNERDMPSPRPDVAALVRARRRKLPDVIAPGLRVLFCGINPGLYTAAIGHHFGRPGNRFWPALHAAGFTPAAPLPQRRRAPCSISGSGSRTCARARRPARTSSPPVELERGGRALAAKARRYRPRVVAILGIGAYRVGFARPKPPSAVRRKRSAGVAGLGPAEPERPQRALWTRCAHPPLPPAARGGGGETLRAPETVTARRGWARRARPRRAR